MVRNRRVGLWIILILVCGMGMGSCTKKEPAGAPKSPEAKSTKPDTSPASPASLGTGALVPLPITLPIPMFSGTPTNINGVSHLEKPLGKKRPDFLAPTGVTNVALNKPVTSSVDEPIMGELSMVTDGDKEAGDQSVVEMGPFTVQVTVDLKAEYELYAILFWHFHQQERVYFDVIVQVSSDPDFIEGVTTLFNNDIDGSSTGQAGTGVGTDMHYVDTSEGKLIDAKGLVGRYVRIYTAGSNAGDMSHFLEIEVYGRPPRS